MSSTTDWAGVLAERGWNLAQHTGTRREARDRLAEAVRGAHAAGMPETTIATHADVTRTTVRRMLGKTTTPSCAVEKREPRNTAGDAR